ncbi:MAG TPA: LysR family transcriptional regulator [Rhodanobacteraceae bacterium]|nr:LysR family transcriptional regulator [Rhodanobacteraceae bacterium]
MEQSTKLVRALDDSDLKLLRLFQSVVRCGGLTAAESELNIGRSTISRHLKALEERLGASLCHRGRSGFALTDEGARVFDAAERLLSAVSQFHTEVEEINDRLRGRLRLALFDKTASNPASRIAAAIGDFARRAPAVELELHVAPTHQIEAGVIDGGWQLGIIPTYRPSPALDYLPLFDEQMYLYCGRGHPLFARPDPAGEERAIWAQRYAGLGFHSPNMDTGNRYEFTRSAEASDQEAIATLVLSGQFIGFLPDHYAAAFAATGQVRALYPQRFHYNCQFAAIYRRSPPPSRLLEIFLDCLRRAHQPATRAQSSSA